MEDLQPSAPSTSPRISRRLHPCDRVRTEAELPERQRVDGLTPNGRGITSALTDAIPFNLPNTFSESWDHPNFVGR